MKFLLDFSESCKTSPPCRADYIKFLCVAECNPGSHQHIGPSASARGVDWQWYRNCFSLLIVINRFLLDFLYWGKVIIVNTMRNIEWATLTGAEVTLNDSSLVESLQEFYLRPDLFLRVPEISVLDQPSPFLLQPSCLMSYFTICLPIRPGGFLSWLCWLTSYVPS